MKQLEAIQWQDHYNVITMLIFGNKLENVRVQKYLWQVKLMIAMEKKLLHVTFGNRISPSY